MTLISKSKSTSCSLDPVPTSLIKMCMNELVPIYPYRQLIIGYIYFPDPLKHAQISQLLKTPKT